MLQIVNNSSHSLLTLEDILIETICYQVNAAAEVIYDLVDPNANLIFGAVVDEALQGQVSIISPRVSTAKTGVHDVLPYRTRGLIYVCTYLCQMC